MADEDDVEGRSGFIDGIVFGTVESHLLEVFGHQLFLLEFHHLGSFGLFYYFFRFFFLLIFRLFGFLGLGHETVEVKPPLVLFRSLFSQRVDVLLSLDRVEALL